MLIVAISYCYAERLYANSHYAKCHYVECRYADCHHADCCGTLYARTLPVNNRQGCNGLTVTEHSSYYVPELIAVSKSLSYYYKTKILYRIATRYSKLFLWLNRPFSNLEIFFFLQM
jgi:hypothetical protein